MRQPILALLVFALGLAAETVFLRGELDLGPFAGTPSGLETRTWDTALRVRAEGWTRASDEFLPSPAYTLILSGVASDEIGAVRRARSASMAVLIPALAGLLLVLLWRPAGPWPAVAAALALGFCAPVLLAASSLSPDALAVLLLLGGLAVLGSSPGIPAWLLAGVFLGLGTRFHAVLGASLIACLLGMLLLRRSLPRRAAGALTLAGAWGAVLILTGLPAALGPAFPGIRGIEIYRGHRVQASGVDPRRGDRDSERWWGPVDYLREVSRREDRRVGPGEAGVYWTGRAAVEAVTHPIAEIRRTGVKTAAVTQGAPLPRSVSADFLIQGAENPALLRIAVWWARVLVPVGLVSLWLCRRRGGARLLPAAAAGLLAAWVTTAGPEAQLLVTVAAVGGVGLLLAGPGRGGGIPPRDRGIGGLVAAVLFALPLAGVVPGSGIQAEDHFQLGALFDREGRGSAALREYERALRLEPMNPYPRYAVAGLLARDNVNQEAIAELERLREDHPDFVPGLLGLTRLYQAERQYVEAAAVYAELMRIEPWNAEHLNNLGTMYVQIGYFDQATRALEAALELDPGYEIARDNLRSLRERGFSPGAPADADSLRLAQESVLAHMRSGNFTAADSTLAWAYGEFGRESAELRFLDGTLRLMRGDARSAIPHLEAAASGLGGTVPVLSNLGSAYAQMGRYEDAKAKFLEVLRLQPANLQVQRALAQTEAALDSLARSAGR